ncbi:MAG: phosphatase PAP2 family protein [Anaerolineales bacterium]
MIRELLTADARLSTQLRVAEKPGPLRTGAIFLAHSGDSWFWGIGLLTIWFFGDAAWKRTALWLLVGIAVTAAIVLAIKFLVRRRRPEGEWGAIYRNTDPHSFPSGHAARMTMLAVLALALGPAWFAGLLLAWAPLVALARVAMGVHYVSDVVAGALLGLVIGLVGTFLLT